MNCLPYIVFTLLLVCEKSSTKPNIILFLTDDQDLVLGGMTPMKNTVKLISNKGVTFENAFVNAPICCPSRSTLLTGRLPHNTAVTNNSISGGCASTKWRQEIEPFSFAPLLENAGYNTFYAGKYLNQYGTPKAGGTSHVPLGWKWWYGLQGNSKYYNFTLSENGTAYYYENKYLTDLIRDKALEFLNQSYIKLGYFFMMLATPAPHAPFTPAQRHRNFYPEVKALKTPAFNFTPIEKHWLLQMPPRHLPNNVSRLDKIQEHRFESLLAVDEMVNSVISKVASNGQLNNTYIIYTSDNGYHIGQFSQPWDKRQPYDTDIRIPLLISGPGLRHKIVSKIPVQMSDLAPTILQMANLPTPYYMDGQSFLSEVKLEQNGELKNRKKNILIEYHGEGNEKSNDKDCPWGNDKNLAECSTESWCKCQDSKNNSYNCIRKISLDDNFLFCKFLDSENFGEAYNLKTDKYQLYNIYSSMSKEDKNTYNKLLEKMLKCRGEQCRNL